MDPSTDPTSRPDVPGPTGPDRRTALIVGGALVAVVVVALAVFLLTRDDGDDVTAGGPTTSTTGAGSSSTTARPSSSTTSTTGPSSTTSTTTGGAVSDEEAASVVWPDPDGPVTYDDPQDAARGFAVDLVGFTDPVVGELQEGDLRSGEVPIRASSNAPATMVTTVLVRQLGDDNWYVIGSTTPDIVVDDPIAGTAIDDPLLVSGQARAFEGTVQVAVYERGSTGPLGEGFVTGSGDADLGPFSGEVRWENRVGGWGVVIFSTSSAEDGSVQQATAIPVGFIGGD